nr:MFS transporter [Micromonospora sp. DSM 115978]
MYLPTFLYTASMGALLPLVPTIASNLGATVALAALVAGVPLAAELGTTLPASRLVQKVGERTAMLLAALLCLTGLLAVRFSDSSWGLVAGVGLIGSSTAVFSLARHAYLTLHVGYARRARAMSVHAGMTRAGTLLGPFAAAAAITWGNSARTANVVSIALMAAVVVAIVTAPGRISVRDSPESSASSEGLWGVAVAEKDIFLTTGFALAALQALRSARQVMLPTWAVVLGIAPADIALVAGACAGLELSLFYVSGYVMDRYGRLQVILPCLVGFILAYTGLALLADPGRPLVAYAAVATAMSLSNAGAGGIMMTLGADLAPKGAVAPFLALWRMINNSGKGAAALSIAGLTAAMSINVAAIVIAAVGAAGAVIFSRATRRQLAERHPGRTVREAAESPPA